MVYRDYSVRLRNKPRIIRQISEFKLSCNKALHISTDRSDVIKIVFIVYCKTYLHGEESSADCENGWALITTKGCSFGGVKVTAGRTKNHCPKGLRKLL